TEALYSVYATQQITSDCGSENWGVRRHVNAAGTGVGSREYIFSDGCPGRPILIQDANWAAGGTNVAWQCSVLRADDSRDSDICRLTDNTGGPGDQLSPALAADGTHLVWVDVPTGSITDGTGALATGVDPAVAADGAGGYALAYRRGSTDYVRVSGASSPP